MKLRQLLYFVLALTMLSPVTTLAQSVNEGSNISEEPSLEPIEPEPISPEPSRPAVTPDVIFSCSVKPQEIDQKIYLAKADGTEGTLLGHLSISDCKYIYDATAATHQVRLALSIAVEANSATSANCPTLSVALLVRTSAAASNFQWPGIVSTIGDQPLMSGSRTSESLYKLGEIGIRDLAKANTDPRISFDDFLHGSLVVFAEEDSQRVEDFTFSRAAAQLRNHLAILATQGVDVKEEQKVGLRVSIQAMKARCLVPDGNKTKPVIASFGPRK